RAAAAVLAGVKGHEILAVAAGGRESARADAGPGHHPRHERPGPRPARGPAVPFGMAAAAPVIADPAVQRLAVLVHAGAVGVAVGSAAVDHRGAPEAGPLLPGDQRRAVGG